MEAILDALPQLVKENIGQCTSGKEPWVKLEKIYSIEEIAEESPTILKNEDYVSVNKKHLNIFEK